VESNALRGEVKMFLGLKRIRRVYQQIALACGFLSLLGLGSVILFPGRIAGQQVQPEIHILPVQGNVAMLVGAGGNITIQTGKDGMFLIDSGLARTADQVYAALRKLSDAPLRYLVNTHFHADHTGGNEILAQHGITIKDNNYLSDVAGSSTVAGARILAHESVLDWLSAPHGNQTAERSSAWPTDTFVTRQKDVFFNGEAIVLYYEPAAHTAGDVIAFFRRSDVISTGDIFTSETYPFIDLDHGGSVQGLIVALNHIIELAVPADKEEGGTYIVPGHGRLCDEADIVEYQTMVTIVRDRIEASIKKGMTLEQVKAAKPTFDYDPHYNAMTGPGTTERFVESVYKSLTKK
jgi:cyclase